MLVKVPRFSLQFSAKVVTWYLCFCSWRPSPHALKWVKLTDGGVWLSYFEKNCPYAGALPYTSLFKSPLPLQLTGFSGYVELGYFSFATGQELTLRGAVLKSNPHYPILHFSIGIWRNGRTCNRREGSVCSYIECPTKTERNVLKKIL
jgi:hypothetical protein